MRDNEIINDFEKEIKYVRENEKYDDFNPIVDIDLCEDILDLINRLKKENNDLLYKLDGVMWSVDKWLDGKELEQDEVNRAVTMREKTLQITEQQQAEIKRLLQFLQQAKSEAIKEFAKRAKAYLHTDDFGTPDERWRPESEFAIGIDNLVKEMTEVEE